MKVHYDKEQDILYLVFRDGVSHEVTESAPNIILELDEKNEIMGLEIWNAKKIGLLEQVAKAVRNPARPNQISGWELIPNPGDVQSGHQESMCKTGTRPYARSGQP